MSSTNNTYYWNIDRIMHLVFAIVIAGVLVWLLRYLSDVLLPFFVALFVAYILQPLVEFNQRWTHIRRNRVIPSLLSLIEVLVVIGALVWAFLPSVVSEFDMLGDIVRDVSSGHRKIPSAYVPLIDFVNKYLNVKQLTDMFDGGHLELLLNKGTTFLAESISFLGSLLQWLLAVIYVIFILIYYPQIANGFKLIFPRKYRAKGLEVVRDVQLNMNHYFRGQGVVALCAMVFYCVGFSIVGLPLAIPMGVIVGILYMIPYFQYVTVIPVAIISFIYSLGGGVEFLPLLGKSLLVYVVSQSVCDYIITPHIMGKEMGMNPAIILLSLSVWGSLLGIIGMIIALPVSALLMSYYEIYISEPRQSEETSQNDKNIDETPT